MILKECHVTGDSKFVLWAPSSSNCLHDLCFTRTVQWDCTSNWSVLSAYLFCQPHTHTKQRFGVALHIGIVTPVKVMPTSRKQRRSRCDAGGNCQVLRWNQTVVPLVWTNPRRWSSVSLPVYNFSSLLCSVDYFCLKINFTLSMLKFLSRIKCTSRNWSVINFTRFFIFTVLRTILFSFLVCSCDFPILRWPWHLARVPVPSQCSASRVKSFVSR
jgi:hypothetical protein